MYNYNKYLYLPSGELSYSPHIFVAPVTHEHTLFSLDIYGYDSYAELILLTLQKYVTFDKDVDVLNLYVKDALYVWMYLLTTDLSNSMDIVFPHKCQSCHKEIKIYLDFSTTNLNILNKYKKHNLQTQKVINEFEFTFELLKMRNLLELSQLLMEFEEDVIVSEYIRLRISSQIYELKFRGELVLPHEYLDVLNSLRQEQIIDLFQFINELENQIGLEDDFAYRCNKCNHINKFQFFDYLMLVYISSKDNYDIGKVQGFIFSILSIAATNNVSVAEFLQFPLRFAKELTNVFDTSKSVHAFSIIYQQGNKFQA